MMHVERAGPLAIFLKGVAYLGLHALDVLRVVNFLPQSSQNGFRALVPHHLRKRGVDVGVCPPRIQNRDSINRRIHRARVAAHRVPPLLPPPLAHSQPPATKNKRNTPHPETHTAQTPSPFP